MFISRALMYIPHTLYVIPHTFLMATLCHLRALAKALLAKLEPAKMPGPPEPTAQTAVPAPAEAATAVCVLPSKARAENGVAAPPNRIFNAAHRQSQVRHERRVVARALHPRARAKEHRRRSERRESLLHKR